MDTNNNNDTNKGRPRWFGPALIALVLLLVGVAGWIIRDLTAPNEAEAPTTPVASTAPTAGAAASAAPGSGEDFAWDCQAQLSTDTSSVADERRDSGLRVGYAHSEAGSLMAAATYAMALDPSMSEEAAENVEVGIAEGPNRDRIEEKAQRIRDGVEEGDDGSASASSTLIGYSQDHYTDESASYQLIYSLPSDNGLTIKAAMQVDVVWEDGDWKLDPASGTELMTSDQYQGQPYVEWGPKS